ncbi:hypothetical protein ACNE9Y_31400 [Pseudomonas sp. NY11226]|uniref:hypothetical protein n=1 Tax=Pseudomonas sp. NY11226 TaxID=3400362 RepID=UPI003A8A8D1C
MNNNEKSNTMIDIPESAFYYGEEAEPVAPVKEEQPVNREINWSFLLACFFGMTTFALTIYAFGL